MKRTIFLAFLAAVARAAAPDAIPLFFVANHGQAPPLIQFTAQGSGLTAFFSEDQVVFRVSAAPITLLFPGARPAHLEGLDPLNATASFITGPESEWRSGVPLFSSIAYRNLYPGIDLIYGGDRHNLKSEFVVSPGADPSVIRMHYTGTAAVTLDETGALLIPTGDREIREQAPVVYQERNGSRIDIPGQFVLASDGNVSFIVSVYDPSLPLVIDPVLSYSTLLGGSNSDAAMALAVDLTGAAYVAGFTASTDFPTASPEQNFNAGSNDVFVAKINPAGNGLVYCTYIGGRGDDRALALAVDSTGQAYIAGSTNSTNFPMKNPLQSKLAGAKNAFLAKLNAAGNTLLFSTYLGGSSSDAANGIALDSTGNIYLVGDTTSTNFPATAFQKSNHGSQDAFVAKLANDGSRIVYSTYLGGSSDEHGAAIAVSAAGNAYITGSTWSTDLPVANAAQSALSGGQDAFAAQLSADGNSLVFSTFLGGHGGSLGYPESGQGIALDSQGSAWIAGVTSSIDFPLSHAIQGTLAGPSDAFIARYSPAGALLYSTYLGGNGMDSANAIAVDSSGSPWIVGQTFSTNLPVVNALQSSSGGDYDAFWAKLSPAGDSVQYLSYLGGAGSDTATAVDVDAAGSLYVAGWTLSTNFPLLNPYQSTNGGNYGAFLSKIVTSTAPTAVSVSPNSGSGSSQTFTFLYSDAKGYAAIASAQILFNNPMNFSGGCYLYLNRAANTLYLTNDAGTAWQPPVTLGQSGTLQNSQCSINPLSSSVSGSGSTLTLNVAVTFLPGFAGARNIYTEVYDGSADSGWQQRGSWTVSAGPPAVLSVTPSSGSGATQTFAFVYSDARGYAAISSTQVLISSGMSFSGGCYLFFSRAANQLYLTNDAGSAWQSPVTLGQSGTLQNSQCSVDPVHSSASGSGSNLTLNIALTFQNAFAGNKTIYSEVYDGIADSGWQQAAIWTVPSSVVPSPFIVLPTSGSGSTQSFTFVFSDANGYAAIASAQILFNHQMTFASGCYIYFNRAANLIYLTNDAGTAWQAPVSLGQSGTLQNSQCSINPANSSSAVGSPAIYLQLTLSITFKAGFSGTQIVYMEVYDGAADSGWQQRGSWTTP
jgi:hypothetical protein